MSRHRRRVQRQLALITTWYGTPPAPERRVRLGAVVLGGTAVLIALVVVALTG